MTPEQPSENESRLKPISPATRRRLQQCFEHASRNSAKGDFGYANDLFSQCVIGDPGNLIYLQSFLGNLQKKYNNNKKGRKLAGIKGASGKAIIKKATSKKDWSNVIKTGCGLLALNPWDTGTLIAMAKACEGFEHDECQLFYLRTALDTHPKDPEVNRLSGLALERMGQFDQAIACWHRVEQAKPGDEEAQRMISSLTVSKTIQKGKYEERVAGGREEEAHGSQADREPSSVAPQQKLQKEIDRHPEEVSNYMGLADLYAQHDQWEEAEKLLETAMKVSGGDLTVRERLEDVQLARGRQRQKIAERRAKEEQTEQAFALVKKIKTEMNHVELTIYAARCDRHPENVALRYELGLRLKRVGKFNDAIQNFQVARRDAKRKALVHLELGECFQYIRQFKLAMVNYKSAVETSSEREAETQKLALYRAGVLAMGLKEWNDAERYLTELASLDFGYKDVAERLDKLNHFRDKECPDPEQP